MMYEHLESLRPDQGPLLASLSPSSDPEIQAVVDAHPSCPAEYLQFLRERGAGAMLDEGEHFVFERQLVSAEREYFQDKQIYDHGAKGDVLIFGWESMGTAYGFDTGDDWQIVEIDGDRTVTKLDLSFKQFVEGLLVCYPQIPTKYGAGKWEDGVKRQYGV
ncbi:hypothetical protein [Rubinisphaera sp. JC750]|uniref:hypothetical protein n=1 Tax=Rubinisphaera sp. JC750 TaxID=2898658 RepID=UPI001F3E7E9C|nr:hypothetical protein [Rubinisphaera sp. JC750]